MENTCYLTLVLTSLSVLRKKINTSPLIKAAICLSIVLNVAFVYKIGKDFYKTQEASQRPDDAGYLFNRQTVFQNLTIRADDIVFIGDSHTQKFELHEFFNRSNVKNRGIDGDNTAGILARLDPIVSGHPKKIFLQIGINDIFKRHDLSKAVPNYKRIISRIRNESPATKIYIQSILPSKFAEQDTVMKYNSIIKQMSRDNGLTFINLYDEFNDGGQLNKKYDCGDAIHLNGRGYVLWTRILSPYL